MRYRAGDARVAWRVVDGEAVLLHAETSAYFGLNRTGTLIWEKLARQAVSADDLAVWLRPRIAGGPADLAEEVTAFLAQLSDLDLLDPAEQGEEQSEDPPGEEIGPYEPPVVMPFGELEKLILSGE